MMWQDIVLGTGNIILMFALAAAIVYEAPRPSKKLCWTYSAVLLSFGIVFCIDEYWLSGAFALMQSAIWALWTFGDEPNG